MKPAPKTSASQHEDFHAANDCGLGGLVLRLTECVDRDHPSSPRDPGSPHREAAFEAASRAERRMAEQQRRIAHLERLAATDELTGALNRRGFESALKRHLAEARRHHEPSVLVIADLDGFKPINDTYGHRAGDKVLRRVARLLMNNVRKTDYVGRLGGDEFAVLLTRTSHFDGNDHRCSSPLPRSLAPRRRMRPGRPFLRFGKSLGTA
ncbi:MAG: GGDEF domain-containing protein [Rhodospirillales bacterium]|nr:GGDEF domain-containing protein [Rhodospirillales bacterium]